MCGKLNLKAWEAHSPYWKINLKLPSELYTSSWCNLGRKRCQTVTTSFPQCNNSISQCSISRSKYIQIWLHKVTHLSKHVCAVCAIKELSPPTWAILPNASPAAHLSMGFWLVRALWKLKTTNIYIKLHKKV